MLPEYTFLQLESGVLDKHIERKIRVASFKSHGAACPTIEDVQAAMSLTVPKRDLSHVLSWRVLS